MSETPEPTEVIESITPSPVGRALIFGLVGAALGIFLGYTVAKILAEDRIGRYEPGLEYDDLGTADAFMAYATETVPEEEPEDLVEAEKAPEATEPADTSEI